MTKHNKGAQWVYHEFHCPDCDYVLSDKELTNDIVWENECAFHIKSHGKLTRATVYQIGSFIDALFGELKHGKDLSRVHASFKTEEAGAKLAAFLRENAIQCIGPLEDHKHKGRYSVFFELKEDCPSNDHAGTRETDKKKDVPCPPVSSSGDQVTDKEYFLWVHGFRAAVELVTVRMQMIDDEIKALQVELDDIIIKKRGKQEYLYRWIDGHWRYFGKASADDVRASMKKKIEDLKEKRKHVHEEVLQHKVGLIEGPAGAHYIVDSKDVGDDNSELIPLKTFCPWLPGISRQKTDKVGDLK